jgi:Permease family
MAKRPAGLIYWVDEKPPAFELAVPAVQHIFLMSGTLVLPVVLVTEIGGGFDQVRAVVALTMIACGLGTIVQAMRWRGIGSGFLCPNLCGPNCFGGWWIVYAAWVLAETERRALDHTNAGNGRHHRICRELHDHIRSPNHFEFETGHAENFRYRYSVDFRPESSSVARAVCASCSVAASVIWLRPDFGGRCWLSR